MKKLIQQILYTALLCNSQLCLANFKSFEAAIEESKWRFQGNPLGCQLSHLIPYYGVAIFNQYAGANQNLGFKINYKRQPLYKKKAAVIRSIAPSWQPLNESRELGEINLNHGRSIISSDNISSWKLLNELESGYFPTFYYKGLNDETDRVSVALSSVGFKMEYEQFLDCIVSLVPHKLKELKKMTLYFDFDQIIIRSSYQNKLKSLAAYIKYDPSIDIVFINGHTDNKGSRSYNQKLAQRRIDSVKKILSQYDVEEQRFKTFAYGEKKPAASNRSEQGRAKNRRVYIRISQN